MLEAFGTQSAAVSAPSADKKISLAPAGMDSGKKLLQKTGSALSKRRFLVALDLLCLLIASIPFFACELKAVGPFKRGFICGDPSITYPHLRNEAIPDELLIAGGIFITGLAIAVGECCRVRIQSTSSKSFVRNPYISCLYKELGSFLFGCCVGQSLTNMAKLGVGRLRPHFLSVCGVTYASLNCTPGTYVATVTCLNSDPHLVEEARKSFFSGHASFAMYTMLYLAFYLQARLTWRGARLLRPMLQFLLVLLAVYTGLTRISEYRHHPTDVLAGYIQGALTAYWVAIYISPMFKSCSSDLSADETPDSPLSPHHTVC
ncbi:phospholipid phosphatase 3-like [Cyprinodon tularosa]|uniref:Phosphatidic acid phosphatase type 2D n=1 Tax=Cyprinodon variegatus TaxID=28743 RepID=A0A3Q2DWS7_CYPVA|nr:PREDICTED: lipid phosphate phosphohydrolase 3-like [Cyprinodon variegatus]XP_038163273.1 phospholipid phosphatase 3-like [Cyprinodon tularosa]